MSRKMTRKRFFELVAQHGFNRAEVESIRLAYWLSKEAHRLQKRDSGERYFEHTREVAVLVMEEHHSFEAIILALLHDVLEDTYTPPEIIIRVFGAEIYRKLQMLSKKEHVFNPRTEKYDKTEKKTDEQYYGVLRRAPWEVQLVKSADRLHNIKSMRYSWPYEDQLEYAQETTTYVLPIARVAAPRIADEIIKICHRVVSVH